MSFNWDDYPVVEQGQETPPKSFDWNDYPVIEGSQQQFETPREKTSISESIIHGAKAFNSKFDEIFHGILQPLYESGYLGEEIAQRSKDVARNRREELARIEELSPTATNVGKILGEIGLNVPSMALGGAGLARGMLTGALAGGARGGASYAMPEESRLENAVMEGALGAGAGAIPGVAKTGYKALRGDYFAKNIAKNIIKSKNAAEETYKSLYSNFFKAAKDAGIDRVNIPKMNTKGIMKHLRGDSKDVFEEFLNTGDLESAHFAQSEVGKALRRLKNTDNTSAYNLMYKAKGKLDNAINKTLEKSTSPEFSKTYKEIGQGYKADVVPYKNKLIKEYTSGESTEKDFIKALSKNRSARKRILPKHPEIGMGKDILKTGGVGSVLFGGYHGLPYLFNKISPE